MAPHSGLRVLLLLYLGSLEGIAMLSSTAQTESEKLPQHLPSTCFTDAHDCPRYFGEKEWTKLTQEKCCPGLPGRVFHCQEHTDHVKNSPQLIMACLPSVQCQAGRIPVLVEEITGVGRLVYIKCSSCPDENTFEPSPKTSYEYLHPACPRHHKQCHPHDGTILAKAGNSTNDATCRCDWKNGFAPFVNSLECQNPSGFDGHSNCRCQRQPCPIDTTLNNEYICVNTASSRGNSGETDGMKVSTQPDDDKEDGKKERNPGHDHGPFRPDFKPKPVAGGDLWYLAVIAIVLLVLGLAAVKLVYHRRCCFQCCNSQRCRQSGQSGQVMGWWQRWLERCRHEPVNPI